MNRFVSIIANLVWMSLCVAGAVSAQEYPKATIAILGGTHVNDEFLYRKELLSETFTVETALGLSDEIHFGVANDVPFYYVHAHGRDKTYATWLALYDLGVTDAIGGATAGGINPEMKPYHYVLPNDFIDMNINRPISFPREVYRDPSSIPIPRYVPAMDPKIMAILKSSMVDKIDASEHKSKMKFHDGGVIVQARGGRFESVAEINMFAKWGGDVVTMNVVTEIVFARMLGINFGAMIIISNPAEGVAEWSFDEMPPLYQIINPLSTDMILDALPAIAAIEGPRVLDELINHPEMTSKPEPDE
ncbi:MAG: hypothetical protein KTR16_06735 [Acidiferrobacterales bacterium]|nr:hypothetical protein [Acidiferrobacterales bacterium]